MGLNMPDSKTYTGGCHADRALRLNHDMAMVTAWNCSIAQERLHFTFWRRASFSPAGETILREYLFNQARHPQ